MPEPISYVILSEVRSTQSKELVKYPGDSSTPFGRSE